MNANRTVLPNHHASHPGFSGVTGLIAAIGFLNGRDTAAALAIELSGLVPGDRLVDIGCGPGVAAVKASGAGADVIGVDPAAVMLRVARLRCWRHRDVEWRIGSAEALPVRDGWATNVWSLATVHHWADLDAGLAEVTRVLRPGGRFVVLERRITDPHASGVASHGSTPDQSEAFAEQCRSHGFVDVLTDTREGHPSLLSVVASKHQRPTATP